MTKKEKKNLKSKQQMWFEGEIDFQKTYEKLQSSAEIIGLDQSGGGRGYTSTDSGNAGFGISDLPGVKFNITPYGKIQIMSSDPTKFGRSEAALYKYLVARDGENPHLRVISKNEIVIDDPSLPIPTLPRLGGKDDYNSKRWRQIEFYAELREDLLDDLKRTESIIEALLKDEKTAICVGVPTYGLRLKHEQAIFIGKGWSKSEIIETLNWFEGGPRLSVPIKDKENEETETALGV